MSNTWFVPSALLDYMRSVSLREPAILQRLRAETAAHPRATMQIAPEQGQLMQLLVELLGVQRALEVGVFTGYSSLAVALAMPDHGHLTACDVSAEFTAVARRYWEEAGIAHKIDLRLAPATDTLQSLIEAGAAATYDMAFIDADKAGYATYYEQALHLLRPNGLMLIDNVLWDGRAADPSCQDPDTVAIRTLNARIVADERVALAMLSIGDGLTLVRKR